LANPEGLLKGAAKTKPASLDGGEAAHAARASGLRHNGLACCSMYCLMTASGAPPTRVTKSLRLHGTGSLNFSGSAGNALRWSRQPRPRQAGRKQTGPQHVNAQTM